VLSLFGAFSIDAFLLVVDAGERSEAVELMEDE
jgi:hypothetical protein